jgi:hypothetical protein
MQILVTGGYVALQQNCIAMHQNWSQVPTNSCAGREEFVQKKQKLGLLDTSVSFARGTRAQCVIRRCRNAARKRYVCKTRAIGRQAFLAAASVARVYTAGLQLGEIFPSAESADQELV